MRPMHTSQCLPSIGSRVDDDNYMSLSTDDSEQQTLCNRSYRDNALRVANEAGIVDLTFNGMNDYE